MKKVLFIIVAIATTLPSIAQNDSTKSEYPGLIFKVGEGKKVKLSFTNQTWLRYTIVNPGTTVDGDPVDNIFDIGLRRTRIVLSGSPFDRTHFFVQLGTNNFNYIAQRKSDFFFHDALADYEFVKEKFFWGAGLTAWGGFSRFSTPSIGSIMGVDAPLFAQATNDATDQFLRKLSTYIKGRFRNFTYNLAVTKPMSIFQSSQLQSISAASSFSQKAPKEQFHSYVYYSFFDKEGMSTPYFKGTYHGKKKVFNIGAGFLYQPDAMWRTNVANDTLYDPIAIFSIDAYYDTPIGENKALSIYAAYYNYNFGPGYIRNVGAMNPANGNSDASIVNGAGAAYPMIGTGNIGYFQAGYMYPVGCIDLMPYGALMLADYDRLEEPMMYFDLGMNVLMNKHRSKFTLAIQNRPVYTYGVTLPGVPATGTLDSRKSIFILQYQIAI